MKLRYKHQRFQAEAARAVTDSFKGQPFIDPTEIQLEKVKERMDMNDSVYGNAPLMIDRTQLTDNVRAVQLAQGLKPIEFFEGEGNDVTLTVEMETGTGKTYTYIKTMYELNKLYGWTKFIIVVPSVAIREGVLKSFQTMDDHFGE